MHMMICKLEIDNVEAGFLQINKANKYKTWAQVNINFQVVASGIVYHCRLVCLVLANLARWRYK